MQSDSSSSASGQPPAPTSALQTSTSGTASSAPSQPASTQAATTQASAPVAKDEPARGELVSIPADLQGRFPAGTNVVRHESGQLVANLPTADNKWHRVVVDGNQPLSKLASDVEAFQAQQQNK